MNCTERIISVLREVIQVRDDGSLDNDGDIGEEKWMDFEHI